MLVQDMSGQLYATPDDGTYGYADDDFGDGFGYGDPVGFPPLLPILGALAPIAAKALPAILPAITGALGLRGAPGEEDGYGDWGESDWDLGLAGHEDFGWADPGQMLYDGFGNPVGIPSLIAPIASAAGGLIGKLVGGGRRRSSGARRMAQLRARALAARRSALARRRATMMRTPMYRPRYRPVPPGWRRPVPGQIPPSRRSYMRCLTWPGSPGLVPLAVAAQAALPGGGGRPRRRRRRRRRRR